jgi:hypothetical protein
VPTAATQRYYVRQDATTDPTGVVHHHWVEAWDDDGHPMIVSYDGLIRVDQVASFLGQAWSIHLAEEPERGLRGMFSDKPANVVWH